MKKAEAIQAVLNTRKKSYNVVKVRYGYNVYYNGYLIHSNMSHKLLMGFMMGVMCETMLWNMPETISEYHKYLYKDV